MCVENVLRFQLPNSNTFWETCPKKPHPCQEIEVTRVTSDLWPDQGTTHYFPTDPEDANARGSTATKEGGKSFAAMLNRNSEETFKKNNHIKNSVNDTTLKMYWTGFVDRAKTQIFTCNIVLLEDAF